MLWPETAAAPGPLSPIGLGCASLGSRVGAAEGLRALARAHEAGITWFDVAPSYGDGQAETILGRFLAGRGGTARVCTKVGLAAHNPGWKVAVRPLARAIVARLPALRGVATRARTVETLPLTAERVTASVEESLMRLGIARIDMLMLHDPRPADVERDDILRALDRLIASGKIAAAGVAGDTEAVRRGAARGAPFAALQVANNPLTPTAGQSWLRAWQDAGRLLITHSALRAQGSPPPLATLAGLLAREPGPKSRLADAGYLGDARTVAADFLTDYALATNARGVALFSAMDARHLDALVRRAATRRDAAAMVALGASLSVLLEGSRDN